jgi:hypothetical protein
MVYTVGEVLSNPYFLYPAITIAVIFFLWKLWQQRRKATIINRSEIMEEQLKDILNQNKAIRTILQQRGNIIGTTDHYGTYLVKTNSTNKLIYFILYSPRWFLFIPKFWNKKIMIVSDDFIKEIRLNSEIRRFKWKKGPAIILKDNFFIDKWYNIRMSFEDDVVKDFIQHRLEMQLNEVKGSVIIAQSLRLTNIDFSKPYTPATAPIEKGEGHVIEK